MGPVGLEDNLSLRLAVARIRPQLRRWASTQSSRGCQAV